MIARRSDMSISAICQYHKSVKYDRLWWHCLTFRQPERKSSSESILSRNGDRLALCDKWLYREGIERLCLSGSGRVTCFYYPLCLCSKSVLLISLTAVLSYISRLAVAGVSIHLVHTGSSIITHNTVRCTVVNVCISMNNGKDIHIVKLEFEFSWN